MAAQPSGQKKPRIRKAPTVRQRIESTAERAEAVPSKRRGPAKPLGKVLLGIRNAIKPVLAPLAPVGRPIVRLFKWLAPSYFVNAWHELRKVTWPNRRETWRLTGAVFIFAVVFGALVAVVDKGLDELFKRVILK